MARAAWEMRYVVFGLGVIQIFDICVRVLPVVVASPVVL